MPRPMPAAMLAALLLAGVPAAAAAQAQVALEVDTSQSFQTVDGFGFFGAQGPWWGWHSLMRPDEYFSDAWLTLTLDDLGVTVWRNELYAEEGPNGPPQDPGPYPWQTQNETVCALKKAADARGVPLKFILTVWSPPAAMKCNGSNGNAGDPTPSTPWKGCGDKPNPLRCGGTLCNTTANHQAYAQWLIDGISKYKSTCNVDVYALSFQNEPLFVESYNSCFYTYTYYAEVFKVIAPLVHAVHPDVKFFTAEHMLGDNIYNNRSQFPYLFNNAIIEAGAVDDVGIFAYHGYSNGVAPTASSELAQLWTLVKGNLAQYGKPLWMTETSGFANDWTLQGGALELAASIHTGLAYGDMAAWVFWQGTGASWDPPADVPGKYALLWYNWRNGTYTKGKNYFVSKQYFRHVRPGAVRVGASVSGSGADSVFATAFVAPSSLRAGQSAGADAPKFAGVVLNLGETAVTVALTTAGSGGAVPAQAHAYRTSASEDHSDVGVVDTSRLTLPPMSVTTVTTTPSP